MTDDARRTFADYKQDVIHYLGNPDSSTLDITAATMVNDALEQIAAIHQWNWLSTSDQSLDITADQDYVELPADYGTLIAIEHDESWTDQMIPVSWQTLLWFRQYPVRSWTSGYFYVITTGNVELGQEDAGLSLPTINLYPTPAEDQPDAIQFVYRRFLRRLKDDTDRPQWPPYMDRALSLLSRSFAAVDYDDDPQSAYNAQFYQMIEDLKVQDGLSQRSYGVPAGAVSARRRLAPFGYPDRGIPDPTTV